MSTVLFTVSRTTNANVVEYQVLLDGVGIPRSVGAEWVMYAQDASGGTREPLTLLEEKFLFGIQVLRVMADPPRLTFCLRAMKDYTLTAFRDGASGKWQVGVKLPSGRMGILTHVHGELDEAGAIPFLIALRLSVSFKDGSSDVERLPIDRALAL